MTDQPRPTEHAEQQGGGMSRYEARAEVDGESIWAVFENGVARYSLTEAEAHIITWALNQVADGRVITALIPPEDCLHGIRYAGFYCQDYKGPTDGVAT